MTPENTYMQGKSAVCRECRKLTNKNRATLIQRLRKRIADLEDLVASLQTGTELPSEVVQWKIWESLKDGRRRVNVMRIEPRG